MGSIWPNRSTTLRAPNSGAQLAQIAPRLAVARNATTVSGMFGRYADHPVAPADAEPLQPGPGPGDLVAQLAPGQLDPVAGLRVARCTAHGRRRPGAPTACSA